MLMVAPSSFHLTVVTLVVIVGVGFVIVIGGLMLLEHCKCLVIVIGHRLRRPGSIGSSDMHSFHHNSIRSFQTLKRGSIVLL